MQAEMSRDKTFNMRVSEDEWKRFEVVAQSYSLPVASLLRMLVKEKYDVISSLKTSEEPEEEHRDVLYQYTAVDVEDGSHADSLTTADLSNGMGYDAKWKGFGRTVNWLCREGFLARRAGTGASYEGKYIYEITPKGRAYCDANWKPQVKV